MLHVNIVACIKTIIYVGIDISEDPCKETYLGTFSSEDVNQAIMHSRSLIRPLTVDWLQSPETKYSFLHVQSL